MDTINRTSVGGNLSKSLGTGLGRLAQHKFKEMSTQKDVNYLSGLLQKSGIRREDADVMAHLAVSNPQHYHNIWSQLTPRQQEQSDQATVDQESSPQEQIQTEQPRYQQPDFNQQRGLQQLLSGLGIGGQKEPQEGVGNGLDLLQDIHRGQLEKTGGAKYNPQNLIQQLMNPATTPMTPEELAPKPRPEINRGVSPVQQAATPIVERPPLFGAKEKAAEALARKEQQVINKTEKPYIDKISAYKEAADDAGKRLDKMEKLVKKGSLPYSGYYNTLKSLEEHVTPLAGAGAGAAIGGALGLAGGPLAPASAAIGSAAGGGIGAAITPIVQALKSFQRGVTSTDTEEFEKLSNDFVKNAKTIFGSRITDADLKAFMSTIPTLSQNDEGKLAVVNNMKSFNKAAQVRYKAMRDVIRENGNRIPVDLQFQVEDRAKPELDAIAREFIV